MKNDTWKVLEHEDILKALQTIAKFTSDNIETSTLFKIYPRLHKLYPDSLYDGLSSGDKVSRIYSEMDKYKKEYKFSLNEKIAVLFHGDKFYDFNSFPEITNERIDFWFSKLDNRNNDIEHKEFIDNIQKLNYEDGQKYREEYNKNYREYIRNQFDYSMIESFHKDIYIYFEFLVTRNFDLLEKYKSSGGKLHNYSFSSQDPSDALHDEINQYILFSEVEEYHEYHRPKRPPTLSMCNPMRTRMDYCAVRRKTFIVPSTSINEIDYFNKETIVQKSSTYKSYTRSITVEHKDLPSIIAKLLPPKIEFNPRDWMFKLKDILTEQNIAIEKQEKIAKILYYRLEKLIKEQDVDAYNFQSPYNESYFGLE